MGVISFLAGNWVRLALYGLVIAGALATAAGFGYHKGVQRLWSYQVEQARQAVKVIVRQGEVTERVVTKYITIRAKAEVIERTIEKEVIRYAETNTSACLDPQWRRLHDGAAVGAVPDPAGSVDGEATTPAAHEAIAAVTENYAICHANADRLEALQGWIRAQGGY